VTVKQLLNRLNATTERAVNQREQLLQEIETELKIHTRLEEEIFYPAFKKAAKTADDHLYYEAVEEHHMVDMALKEMKAADAESEEFSAKAKVLQDLVLHQC
jgi:iron-sulfur cluster repair protein YtfE (RIC family)